MPTAVLRPPLAVLSAPSATALFALATAVSPTAVAEAPAALLPMPTAVAELPLALACEPSAVAFCALAFALAPTAVALTWPAAPPPACAPAPTAVAKLLLFAPPAWTDQYYGRKPRQERLDQVIDTAFYARSHHVGLVQIADLFAYLFRRYAELRDYGDPEAYGGELRTVAGWVEQISERLVALAHRCPKRPTNDVAEWYVNACPTSLRTLQRT